MIIKIINRSSNALPQYETASSAGMDIRASLEKPIVLRSMERSLIPTGLFLELPIGYEAQVRPRSGLALHHGITVLNSPGTIDSDYRGEIKILLINLSTVDFKINPGDRIAQMIISSHLQVKWEQVEVLAETDRGSGGYGHTGV